MYIQEADSVLEKYVTPIPISVLLIDDEFLIGEAMRIKLSTERDIIFNYCKEPDKALETAIGVQPTVIMLDLVMPGVNGLTMVKFFKSSEDFRDVPLIVLSAREEPELKKKAIALGANDYMVKLQGDILRASAELLPSGGCLAYVTCTLNPEENERRIEGFVREHPKFACLRQAQSDPGDGLGEFFYGAVLRKS